MVFSELAAATLIAICGLKNSYRIILKGERLVRRTIHYPAPAIEGYQTFPRYFIRRIFRAGLIIANRWQGRAHNAAQIAADTRKRARRASSEVAKRAENVRNAAQERAEKAKIQAAAARQSMQRLTERMTSTAANKEKKPSSSSGNAAGSSSSTRKMCSMSSPSTPIMSPNDLGRSQGLGQGLKQLTDIRRHTKAGVYSRY